jgi:hypothetical protein
LGLVNNQPDFQYYYSTSSKTEFGSCQYHLSTYIFSPHPIW